MRLKPKTGYWDLTHYPIGGSFHRATAEGLELDWASVSELDRRCSGSTHTANTTDGRRIAFNIQYTEQD